MKRILGAMSIGLLASSPAQALPTFIPPPIDRSQTATGVGSRSCDRLQSLKVLLPPATEVFSSATRKPKFAIYYGGTSKYRVTVSQAYVPQPLYDRWFARSGASSIEIDANLEPEVTYRLTVSTPCSQYPSDVVYVQAFFKIKPFKPTLAQKINNKSSLNDMVALYRSYGYDLDAIALLFQSGQIGF